MRFNRSRLREALGAYNSAEVAHHLGVIMDRRISRQAVQNWLDGSTSPTGEMMAGLCVFTKKPIAYFFDAKVGGQQTNQPRKAAVKAARA